MAQIARYRVRLDKFLVVTTGNPTIDTSFDFRVDSGGKDPDTHSPTLRRYHQLLWSRPLPGGTLFALDREGGYLHHRSTLGEFWLSSDSVLASFTGHLSMAAITSQFSAVELAEFDRIGSTIGGMTIFPSQKIDNKPTINGARGMHPKIKDRMDLTLECIRRYYCKERSPLSDTLARYDDFFALFGNFNGYVDFFLFDDLLSSTGAVRFFMPFDDFRPPAVPTDTEAYRQFRDLSVDFVEARNRRIASVALYAPTREGAT